MSPRAILGMALAAGFRLESRGAKLHVQPTPTPDLIARLRHHKGELLKLLERGPDALTCADAIAWIDRPDVVTVVEDLFRERWHPDRIARELGLTRAEVRTILRVAGGQGGAHMAENCRTQRNRR